MSLIDQLIPPLPLDEESQMAVGRKIEKEHFKRGVNVDRTPSAVARRHIDENPRYYPARAKKPGEKEKLVYTQEHCGHCPEDEARRERTRKRMAKLRARRPDLTL